MSALKKEAYGPTGDPARYLPRATLEAGLRSLAPPPIGAGALRLIVLRRADGARETPPAVRLTPEEGVPGDGWSRRPPRDPDAQLAVMWHGVAELIANGQPLTLFGDNLFVDLDISADSLAVGTRLRVGQAILEMTPKPHDGCRKFKARFGDDAYRFVQAVATRRRNLRGVYWRVIEAGEAAVGAAIHVLGAGPRPGA